MGYDLEVYAQEELRLNRAVESLGREDVGSTAEWGDTETSGLSLLRRTKRTERHLCTADGPLAIDEKSDDVPIQSEARLRRATGCARRGSAVCHRREAIPGDAPCEELRRCPRREPGLRKLDNHFALALSGVEA